MAPASLPSVYCSEDTDAAQMAPASLLSVYCSEDIDAAQMAPASVLFVHCSGNIDAAQMARGAYSWCIVLKFRFGQSARLNCATASLLH